MKLTAPWLIENPDNEEKESETEAETERKKFTTKEIAKSSKSLLEALSHDLTTHIFAYLPLASIHSITLTSKFLNSASNANEFWRIKYTARWNIMPDLPWPKTSVIKEPTFWKRCFENAFRHTHDLWITHWNCVLPHDGESDGRTCIPDVIYSADNEKINNLSVLENSPNSFSQLCPTCRLHPLSSNYEQKLDQFTTEREIYFHKWKNSKQQQEQEQELFDNDPVTQAKQITWETDEYTSECVRQSILYSTAKYCRRIYALQSGVHNEQANEYLSSYSKHQQRSNNYCHQRRKDIERAFCNASTFHRKISLEQYRSSGIKFFTDALFFSTSGEQHQGLPDNGNKSNSYNDKYDLYHDVYGKHNNNQRTNIPPQLQISQHSWHVCRLQNPDFTRPITFKTWIQRSDCFAVFPAQGFIQPGDTTYIYFSLKPKGSVLATCVEELDIKREECHTFHEEQCFQEGNLPLVPFLIRYMFAPILPMGRSEELGKQNTKQNKEKQLLKELWESRSIQKMNAQSLYVSAHVNSNYTLEQFQNETLVPFEICSDIPLEKKNRGKIHKTPTAMVFVAPNLQRKADMQYLLDTNANEYINVEKFYNMIQNSVLNKNSSLQGTKSQCCIFCRNEWGLKAEEFGRRYVLRKLTCKYMEKLRKLKIVRVWECLNVLASYFDKNAEGSNLSFNFDTLKLYPSDVTEPIDGSQISLMSNEEKNNRSFEQLNRMYKLLYHIRTIIFDAMAYPNLQRKDEILLKDYECYTDYMCVSVHEEIKKLTSLIQMKESIDSGTKASIKNGKINLCNQHDTSAVPITINKPLTIPWRIAGVYKHIRCTDSIVQAKNTSARNKILCSQHTKPEAENMNNFRHFLNSPGTYELGRQEDPNHLTNSDFIIERPEIRRPSYYSDIFKDNMKYAITSTCAMIQDPRSLMVHGVYDHVKRPCVIRAPFMSHFVFWPLNYVKDDIAHFNLDKTNTFAERNKNTSIPGKKLNISWNDPDPDGYAIMNKKSPLANNHGYPTSSMERYLMNIPPLGIGRHILSTRKDPLSPLIPISIDMRDKEGSDNLNISRPINNLSWRIQQRPRGPHVIPMLLNNAPPRFPMQAQNNNERNRMHNVILLVCTYLGWYDSHNNEGTPIVDRRILIAAQWWSNSLMIFPMICTLLARWQMWITILPLDYHLEGLPFECDRKMRYLTSEECGYAAMLLFLVWINLCRQSERFVGRTMERAIIETNEFSWNAWYPISNINEGFDRLKNHVESIWDIICPLFLQRLIYMPKWNINLDYNKKVLAFKAKIMREKRSGFHAERGLRNSMQELLQHNRGSSRNERSENRKKMMLGILVAFSSFCISSPHFILNFFTIFYCSVAFGLSLSVQSMEFGHDSQIFHHSFSIKKTEKRTIVLAAVLVGHLVGCSGGILFLAEFVVTSVSLILGGAATISSHAIESWIYFSCFSTVAFWGYLLARVGSVNGMRRKKCSSPSCFLMILLAIASIFWVWFLLFWNWDVPTKAMIVRLGGSSAFMKKKRKDNEKTLEYTLQ